MLSKTRAHKKGKAGGSSRLKKGARDRLRHMSLPHVRTRAIWWRLALSIFNGWFDEDWSPLFLFSSLECSPSTRVVWWVICVSDCIHVGEIFGLNPYSKPGTNPFYKINTLLEEHKEANWPILCSKHPFIGTCSASQRWWESMQVAAGRFGRVIWITGRPAGPAKY